VRQIHAVSTSPEMAPFIITGTNYNRPICRRLVEEAGVRRELFGMKKKAAELPMWQEMNFMTADSMNDYLKWLREHRFDWYRHLRIPPWRSIRGDAWLNRLNVNATTRARQLAWQLHNRPYLRKLNLQPLLTLNPKTINLRRYYFPWAVERAKLRYRKPADGQSHPPSGNGCSTGAYQPVTGIPG
jgi:hypothetical protein